MRNIGRFTGFATSKALFYDIPNFNKIPNMMSISTEGILVRLDNSPKKKLSIRIPDASMIKLYDESTSMIYFSFPAFFFQ